MGTLGWSCGEGVSQLDWGILGWQVMSSGEVVWLRYRRALYVRLCSWRAHVLDGLSASLQLATVGDLSGGNLEISELYL